MTPVANPTSVLAMITTFEALPIVQVNDTSIQALANQIYNQGQIGGTNATTAQQQQGWGQLGDIGNNIGAMFGF